MPVPAHGERRGSDGAAEVEGEDLGFRVTAELERHQRQQHRFARAGRADDERVADIPDMEGKPERRTSLGLAIEQGGRTEMVVPFRPCPHSTQGDHVGKIERRDRRLPDIGIGMTGQRAEPGIDRVDGLGHCREIAALNDLLGEPQLFVGDARIGIPDRDRGRDIGHARHVLPEFLQGHIGVGGLVGRIGVDQRGLLVGHHLLDDRSDRFALGEPLPADFGEQPCRFELVEEDRPRAPAIGKCQPVHFIQQAWRGRGREADDGEDTQMLIA